MKRDDTSGRVQDWTTTRLLNRARELRGNKKYQTVFDEIVCELSKRNIKYK